MWFLIFATCTGSFEAENLECTEAEVISKHISQEFCVIEMKPYEKSGNSVLCIEEKAVKVVDVWQRKE